MPGSSHSGIGKELRQARKEADLSIEEVAWRTRIRPEVLRALEKEHFAGLGHHAHVLTMLRTVAKALDIDPCPVADLYRARYEPVEPSSLAALDEQRKTSVLKRPRFRWVHAAALAGVILLVASAVGVLRGPGTHPRVRQASVVDPALQRIDRMDEASRGADRRADGERSLRGVRLGMIADRQTYVDVSVDGSQAFQGLLAPGTSRFFSGVASIEFRTTSAKTVQLWLNGERFSPAATGTFSAVFGPSGPLAS